MIDALKALQHETDFLSGVESNLEAAKSRSGRRTIWERVESDEGDRLRAVLASQGKPDRELLKSLPANRRVALHGFERRWLFGRRPTSVTIASVLCPLSHYAKEPNESAPAIGLGELSSHVRKLSGAANVPHLIGVCSPTGFTEEARKARLDLPNVTVVLVEPDEKGGWRTSATGASVDPRVLRIFDPESSNQKTERVRQLIEESSADLLTGGVSVSSFARKLSLPEGVVRAGFERAAREDPELRIGRQDGEILLFRGAPSEAQEKRPMGMFDRIRQLFAREGNEVEKINLLAERRAALARRRDRIYEDIGKLEVKEADLLAQGSAAQPETPRRRLAAQLAQLRKDIARQNTSAGMLNQQINIISTDIHNLTLIQQGQMASLPETAELTENAVRAEELLETLKADNELVASLTTGLNEAVTSSEEMAILEEFRQAVEPPKAPESPLSRSASVREAPSRTPDRPAVERIPSTEMPNKAEAEPT